MSAGPVAAELGISNQKAARWRRRSLTLGLTGLERDAPRPGRILTITEARVLGGGVSSEFWAAPGKQQIQPEVRRRRGLAGTVRQ